MIMIRQFHEQAPTVHAFLRAGTIRLETQIKVLILEVSAQLLRAGAGGLDLGLEQVHARCHGSIKASG